MRRLLFGPMLAIACLGLCTTPAWADLFGIQFLGRGIGSNANVSSTPLAPTDMAGVIPQAHYNIDPTQVGSPSTHTLTQLMDSTGTHTSLSLSVSANDSWFSHSADMNTDPNHTLLNGIIKATSSMPATYTFTNLAPGGTYTLIAYTVENDGVANNNLTIGGTTFFTTAQNGINFNGTFIRATNTSSGGTRDLGNYVQFDNVTADASGRLVLTDAFISSTDGAGIAGIQLQGPTPVPEPAGAVLLGLGALVLAGLARWRRII